MYLYPFCRTAGQLNIPESDDHDHPHAKQTTQTLFLSVRIRAYAKNTTKITAIPDKHEKWILDYFSDLVA